MTWVRRALSASPARLRCAAVCCGVQRSAAGDNAEVAVGALYQASAVSLIRLPYIMLGDRPSADDVVQEAFGPVPLR